MNAAELVAVLEGLGVSLWAEGGQLRFRAPEGVLTDLHRQQLRADKEAVLDVLRAAAGQVSVVADGGARFEPFPVTDMQAAYLLGRRDVFSYGGVSCHGYGELEFTELDPVRLEAAWQRLIERHDMLRAVVDDDGTQRVLPKTSPYRISFDDLSELGEGARAKRIAGIREEMDHRVQPNDVWPLFELRVSREPALSRLHFSIDFLIADFVSIQLLLEELRHCYEHPDEPLPPLEVTFRDYLAAERQLRSGPRYERDRQYWLGRIDELPPRPDLPMAETTGSAGQARFRRYALMLEPEQWSALRDRARAKGMTPSTAVLAAYAEVIGKWCRRPDFTLNLTLLNRQPLHADVPRIIGDFTSVDLLGVWQNRATSFADRAAALQDQVWRDLDHRLFSGVEVMREIARRNDSDAALMPIVFTSAIGVGGTDDGLGENQWGRLGYGISQTPQVFIDCQNIERSGGLSTNWDVREGVLPESVVADMFAAYRQLLTRMCTEDEVWTKRFPVDLPEHQRVRRHSVNDTAAPMPDALLHDGFIAQAERASHRTAILSARGELTYGELLDRARGVAAALREAGCQRGDVVGVVMDKGWEQVAAVLGIHLGGAAYVPVDTAQPEVRRERMLGDAGVRLVLTQTWLHDELGLPEGITSIVVDEHGPAGASAAPDERAAPDDLAYVIFTSGSTGRPKGVMITHRSAVNTINDINTRFGVTGDDRALMLANLGFDLSVYDIFGTLALGGALVIPEHDRRSDPSHWAELVAEHGVTVWNSVPAQMQMLQQYLDAEQLRLPAARLASLRLALLSGDWIPVGLPAAVDKHLPELRMISLGGATEAAIWSIFHEVNTSVIHQRSIPYGKPLTNQTFHVLDQDMQDCPEGTVGELYIGGAGVALGYLGDPERTAERFVVHPTSGLRLYRTGDLGRYREDSEIEFLGREDSQVKIRGHRIELAEVEAALQSHPQVGRAIAVVDGERSTNKRLAAFVEGREPEAEPPTAEPVVREVTRAAQLIRRGLDADIDRDRIAEFLERLDAALLHAMTHALADGDPFAGGAVLSADQVAAALGVAQVYRSLVPRWLAELAGAGFVEHDENGYHDLRVVEAEQVERCWAEAEAVRPERICPTALMGYFRDCARQLRQLLRGEVSASRMFFPEGRMDIAEATYSDGVAADHNNQVAAQALRAIAAQTGGKRLRVLEVGGGIASTTRHVMDVLAGFDVDYTFTDVSQFFLNGARTRFAAQSMDIRIYDINQDYREQGLRPQSFDVVLCGGVLNNARDIAWTLRQLKEMLVPGGWLVFIEATGEHLEINVSQAFMMEEFEDFRREEGTTFLDRRRWLELVGSLDADWVTCLPAENDPLSLLGQHVFVVRLRPGKVRVEAADVVEHARKLLPEHMLPVEMQVVHDIPLSDNGKVDRGVLQQWLARSAPTERADTAEDHGDELEERLASMAADVLGVPRLGREQNFFDCGGDSLLVAQLVGRIREQVPEAAGLYFDGLLRRILNQPTIAALAEHIRQTQRTEHEAVANTAMSPLIVLNDPGAEPLRVLVHEGIGTMAPYRWLAKELLEAGPLVGLAVNDTSGYLGLPAEELIPRLAERYARELLDQGGEQFHIVGYCLGGLLATEIAGRLTEAGAHVASLVVVSSYRVPYQIGEELLFEYAFGRVLSADLGRMGFPTDEQLVGQAFQRVLAATPGQVPDGAFDALDGQPGLVEVAERFRALRRRSPEERRAAMARQFVDEGLAVGSPEQATQLYEVFRQSFRAANLHQPELYAGDMTLLRPRGTLRFLPGLQADMTEFWRDVCLGELDVIDVAGDHFSCLDASNVAEAVRHIRAVAEKSAVS